MQRERSEFFTFTGRVRDGEFNILKGGVTLQLSNTFSHSVANLSLSPSTSCTVAAFGLAPPWPLRLLALLGWHGASEAGFWHSRGCSNPIGTQQTHPRSPHPDIFQTRPGNRHPWLPFSLRLHWNHPAQVPGTGLDTKKPWPRSMKAMKRTVCVEGGQIGSMKLLFFKRSNLKETLLERLQRKTTHREPLKVWASMDLVNYKSVLFQHDLPRAAISVDQGRPEDRSEKYSEVSADGSSPLCVLVRY